MHFFRKRKSQENKRSSEKDEEQRSKPQSKEKETIEATRGQYSEPISKIPKGNFQVPGQKSIDGLI